MSDALLTEIRDLLQKQSGNRTERIGGTAAASIGPDTSQAIQMAQGGLTAVKKFADDTLGIWQTSANLGLGFNNDAVGLRTSIMTTRLSVEEYSDVINRARQGFTSLGGSMTESAKAFNKLSYDFSNTDAVDKLSKLGYTTKDFNEILALSVAGKRLDTLNDKEASLAARNAAENLATEMDKVAQLTGVSRRAQMDALMEQQRDARLQATLEIELRRGGREVADMYKNASVQLQGLGLERLGKELFTGQALSQKAIDQLNALGPAGTQLREAMNAVRNARTAEQRQQAEQMLQNAQAAVAARQQQDSYLALVQRGVGPVADAAGEIFISSMNYKKALETVKEETNKNGRVLTDQQLAQEAERRVRLAQEGKDAQGRALEGAKTTELAVQAINRYKDAFVVSAQIIEATNRSLGRGAVVKNLIDQSRNVKIDEKTGEATAASQRIGGREGLQRLPEAIDTDRIGEMLPGILKETAKYTASLAIDTGKGVGQGILDTMIPGLKDFFVNIKNLLPDFRQTRDEGTIGKTGNLTEPKDFYGKVAKDETVFTPDQLKNFAQGIKDSTKVGIPLEVTSLLQNIQTELSRPAPNDNIDLFADMFRNIQTTISSANAPSKNPADDTNIIIAATNISRAVGSVTSAIENISIEREAPTVEVNVGDKFSGFFKDLQAEFPKISGPIKMSIDNLATIIPNAVQQPQARELSRTIPNEIKQARVESERREEERRKVETTTRESTETTPTTQQQPPALNDLKDLLDKLNSTMAQVAANSNELINVTDKQVRATRRLDPNIATRG